MAERDDGDRYHLGRQAEQDGELVAGRATGSVVSVEPRPSAWAASSRFCTAGKTEASSVCGKVSRVSPQTTTSTGARGDASHRPVVHVVEEGGGQSLLLEGPGAALPQARRHGADGGAQRGLAHDDEHEGLAVLGAGRVGGRGQDADDRVVVDVVGEERTGGPLGVHHVEEVGRHGGDGSDRDEGPPPVVGLGAAEVTRYLWRCTGPGGRCPP